MLWLIHKNRLRRRCGYCGRLTCCYTALPHIMYEQLIGAFGLTLFTGAIDVLHISRGVVKGMPRLEVARLCMRGVALLFTWLDSSSQKMQKHWVFAMLLAMWTITGVPLLPLFALPGLPPP